LLTKLLLDSQQLVVLGDTLGASRSPGLDLTYGRRDHEVRNEGVLGFAGSMRDNRAISGATSDCDRLEGLGQRSDLVELDED
jgi:hypothetical protein